MRILDEGHHIPKRDPLRLLKYSSGPDGVRRAFDYLREVALECRGYDPYNSATTHLCVSRDVWNNERVKQVRTWNPWRYPL